jgi:hypothetical protein
MNSRILRRIRRGSASVYQEMLSSNWRTQSVIFCPVDLSSFRRPCAEAAFAAARKAADEVFVEVPGAAGPERVEYDKQYKLGISKFNSKPEKVGELFLPRSVSDYNSDESVRIVTLRRCAGHRVSNAAQIHWADG